MHNVTAVQYFFKVIFTLNNFCLFFRQIKELNKKVANIKRTNQLEREKQAQLLNEVKKQEGQNDEKVDEIKVIIKNCS